MATRKQISVVAAKMVEYQDGFKKLSHESVKWAMEHPKEAVSMFVKMVNDHVNPTAVCNKTAVLGDIIATIRISATTERFVAEDKFKVDISENAKIKISYIGDNFKSRFAGKTEEPFAGGTVCGREINKNSVNASIIAKFGGQAEITLFEVYAMMERQANGEAGALLNNNANIFYVLDVTNTLCAVYVGWGGVGWDVDVISVKNPGKWFVGSRVFYHNSLIIQAT